MYSQLGSITFDGKKTPTAFSLASESNIAEHPLIENRPTLQRVGDKLDTISLSMFFDQSFCDPSTEIEALKSSRQLGEIMSLIMGDGSYLGEFVIKKVDINRVSDSPNGTMQQADVTVELIEFFDPDKETTTQLSAISSGFAMATNTPQEFAPVFVPVVEQDVIMENVVSANANSNTAANILSKISASASLYRPKAEAIIRNMNSSAESLNSVLSIISDPANESFADGVNLTTSISVILLTIGDVITECNQLIADVENGDVSSASTRALYLSNKASELKTRQNTVMSDATTIANKSVTK